jgi:hypothetical protein
MKKKNQEKNQIDKKKIKKTIKLIVMAKESFFFMIKV